jgi:hypothetical protein
MLSVQAFIQWEICYSFGHLHLKQQTAKCTAKNCIKQGFKPKNPLQAPVQIDLPMWNLRVHISLTYLLNSLCEAPTCFYSQYLFLRVER